MNTMNRQFSSPSCCACKSFLAQNGTPAEIYVNQNSAIGIGNLVRNEFVQRKVARRRSEALTNKDSRSISNTNFIYIRKL